MIQFNSDFRIYFYIQKRVLICELFYRFTRFVPKVDV
jgi:hypothetical protein